LVAWIFNVKSTTGSFAVAGTAGWRIINNRGEEYSAKNYFVIELSTF
jgi:hypothetical protein